MRRRAGALVREVESRGVVGLLDRDIAAHGGADRLGAYGARVERWKGSHPGKSVRFSSMTSVQLPDKWRHQLGSDVTGRAAVFVVNGDRGWLIKRGRAEDLAGDDLTTCRERLHAEHCLPQLVSLKGSEYTLTLLGEAEVGGRPAVGMRVSRKSYGDVSLIFDKQRWLLLKMARQVKVAQAGLFTAETLYDDYRAVNGIQVAHRRTVRRDGRPVTVYHLTEVKFHERLDARLFARP